MKTLKAILSVALFLAIAAISNPLRADVAQASAYELFGISAGYNNVIFGDLTGGYGKTGTKDSQGNTVASKTGGDIEGHAAIQGNVTVRNFGFGNGQMGTHTSGPVLVVGGNMRASGADVYDGNAYIGGKSTYNSDYTTDRYNVLGVNNYSNPNYNKLTPDYKATTGNIYVKDTTDSKYWDTSSTKSWQAAGVTSLPFDFTVAKTELTMVSSTLSHNAVTATGAYSNPTTDPNKTTYNGNYVIDLTGMSGVQTVAVGNSIFADLVKNGGFFNIIAGADTTLILNVFDDNGTGFLNLAKEIYINGQTNRDLLGDDFNGSNILINVDSSISQITSTKAEINASILAINSTIDVNSGHISGQVFAQNANLYNGGEFHAYYTFNDSQLTPSTNVTPEPASMLIFGAGALGLGLQFRRRKDNRS